MPRLRLRSACSVALLVSLNTLLHSQQQSGLRVADLLTLEQLGPVAVSPNGEWLAVVIVRAMTDAKVQRDFAFGRDRADVWLVARQTGERLNITKGTADGSGSWNAVWAPDSKRLAFLSTKGGDKVRPYVYDLGSGAVRRLTERGADLEATVDDGSLQYQMLWADSTTLLCPVWPEAAPPASAIMTKIGTYARAEREWAKAMEGREPTVSVLESGRKRPALERPRGDLLAVDVISGESRVALEGNVRRMLISPGNRYLAIIVETGRVRLRAGDPLPSPDRLLFGLLRTRLAILPLGRHARARWLDGVVDPQLTWNAGGLSWSPDGSSLAVIARDTNAGEAKATLSLVSAATGTVRDAGAAELDVTTTMWSSGGELLYLARPRRRNAPDADTARHDWWVVDGRAFATPRKLTGRLKSVPSALVPTAGRNTVLGVASGRAWLIETRSGGLQELRLGEHTSVRSVVWPTGADTYDRGETIVEAEDDALYRVTWAGGRAHVTPFPLPSKNATLGAFLPKHRLAVFSSSERNGTFVWMGDGRSKHFAVLVALNKQLAEIGDAERIALVYRGTDGDTLAGLLLLPIGYERGKRYPLVTWVYAGFVVSDTSVRSLQLFQKDLASPFNLHLLPTRGYAVLIPSMPLPPHGQPGEPWIDLAKGVITAVDKVIDLGIADPNRLGVMGHSHGGYSTYALVTYTRRFKAAVASAGTANLASVYGTFFTPYRYDRNAHEDLFFPLWSESSQGRMNSAPWIDPLRYFRNSPLYYVDRVHTPVMIIQGDMDYVPLQQGEEFFTALYREGKEAVFVRYWGEGHVISSPANLRDMWKRIFAWFDEHLAASKSAESNRAQH